METEAEKGLYSAVSMRGLTQRVLGELPTNKRQTCPEPVSLLKIKC